MLVYHYFRGDIASQIGMHARAEIKTATKAGRKVHPAALPRSNAVWVFVGCKRVSL